MFADMRRIRIGKKKDVKARKGSEFLNMKNKGVKIEKFEIIMEFKLEETARTRQKFQLKKLQEGRILKDKIPKGFLGE